MSASEDENKEENERAGGEPPARRREGVQHVVNDDNKDVTRGCRKGAESDAGYLRSRGRGELEHLVRRVFTLVTSLATVAHAELLQRAQ